MHVEKYFKILVKSLSVPQSISKYLIAKYYYQLAFDTLHNLFVISNKINKKLILKISVI